MAARAIVPILNSRPRFLEGFGSGEITAIVSAAKQRRYLANSVIVNQGHAADHLFLLTNGRARYFYVTPDGRKIILMWLPPGNTRRSGAIVLVFGLSRQHRSGEE
jgi:CRP-like cAMP-binding protein